MGEWWWAGFREAQAIDGRVLRLLALLAPRRPRPAEHEGAHRIVPSKLARATVVIPCYNYGRFLSAAVESALGQCGVDVEVIIVDDRSTDDSREVAARLVDRHPQVRIILNETNVGHVESFNAGWRASTGEFVVKLDADDLLTPDSLSRAVALFEAHPSVGLVYGHPRHFSTTEPPRPRASNVRWTVWKGMDWLEERCRLGVSAITNPEMVVRSSLLHASGGMNPAVDFAPDMEISLRVAALSDIGYIGGADQALHREHPGSMSRNDGSGMLVDLDARRSAFTHALSFVASEAGRARLAALADRALAEDALRLASAMADRNRAGVDFPRLLSFARTVCPTSTGWPDYRRLTRSTVPGGSGGVRPLLRRARRRWRQETYFTRWMVSGV